MRIDVPMPLLLKGRPARCDGERYIWLRIMRSVDVPEISEIEVETVLETAGSSFFRKDRIVARDGVTYTRLGDQHDLFAFTSPRIGSRPSYIGQDDVMRSFAVSRSVMEYQARSMFLDMLDTPAEKLWPRQPPQMIQRDLFDFETYSSRLRLDEVTGMDDSMALQDRALEGLIYINGELWAECGKPCIVVRAHDNARRMASIGISTLPMWTDTGFSNAYFALNQIEDAKLYRAALTHELGSNNFLDRMPEYEFEARAETSFDADEWEAERLTEVIGTEVLALSRMMENAGYLTTEQLASAEAVYMASRETNHLLGTRVSVMEHLGTVLEAWKAIGYRTRSAEVPAPKAALMKLPANRAILAVESATISVPVAPWSPSP
ncbi:hypothetical protein OIU34_24320 [Pararhizobium sp. BT-229]|uniref:hypothetical protein n=1 Tax=Pararhizobium sp. BT-229 TaxID=2986923 RepID=UPI0021F7D45B|nr:hypothetical protein [Pararhizobium sp. BT-229]MCV9965026.1 hypothetical protein [Pararhizobium sp. BT-229]